MEHLTRPVPLRTWSERLRAWVEWFGPGRLVAAASATVIVCIAGFWLVRSPAPPTEASLPHARTSTTTSDTGGSLPMAGAVASTSTTAQPTRVVVHVAGSVVEPGVYDLDAGARVRDAVMAAGGPTAAADWNALNLAAVVDDATRVYVPAIGEEVPVTAAAAFPGTAAPTEPVNVNEATVDQLDTLPGVGPSTATAIVTERERNGPFAGVDDLERVPGIGPAKLESIRDLVTT